MWTRVFLLLPKYYSSIWYHLGFMAILSAKGTRLLTRFTTHFLCLLCGSFMLLTDRPQIQGAPKNTYVCACWSACGLMLTAIQLWRSENNLFWLYLPIIFETGSPVHSDRLASLQPSLVPSLCSHLRALRVATVSNFTWTLDTWMIFEVNILSFETSPQLYYYWFNYKECKSN